MTDLQNLVKRLEQQIAATAEVDSAELLEAVIKGRAVELWSDAAGRLFLVADEQDAAAAMACCGARRGEIYTAVEARRIVAINDPEIIQEIHAWKRQFDGVLRALQYHRK